MNVRGRKRTPQRFNPVHCSPHPDSNHRPSLRLRCRGARLEFHVRDLWISAGNRKHERAAVAPSAQFSRLPSWNNWSCNWFLEHRKEIMGLLFFSFCFSLDKPTVNKVERCPSAAAAAVAVSISASLASYLLESACIYTWHLRLFSLISEVMHMNSAYFAEIVLMRALFRNLDYSPCYQKKKKTEGEKNKDEKPFFFFLFFFSFCGHWFPPGAPPLNLERHISADIMNLKKAGYYGNLWHFDIIKCLG